MANLDAEIKRLMATGMSEADARELAEYDAQVEHDEKTEFDLTAEQQKVAKNYTATHTKKTPTTYNFKKRERKPNDAKREIINFLKNSLTNTEEIKPQGVTVTNIERQIDFTYSGEQFSITLTQHRPKK